MNTIEVKPTQEQEVIFVCDKCGKEIKKGEKFSNGFQRLCIHCAFEKFYEGLEEA